MAIGFEKDWLGSVRPRREAGNEFGAQGEGNGMATTGYGDLLDKPQLRRQMRDKSKFYQDRADSMTFI